LQDVRNGALRYAEWFYGPQKRILGSYELGITKAGFFNDIRANINYQDIEESRQTRDYKRYDRFDSRREHIKVWAFTFDGHKLWGQNELTVGIDGQLNDLKSVADRTNLTTGAHDRN
jgi:hemoglobin/transferrin/lactoferrin receptor protein